MFLLSSNQMNAFVSSYLCPGNWDFVVVFVALVFVAAFLVAILVIITEQIGYHKTYYQSS